MLVEPMSPEKAHVLGAGATPSRPPKAASPAVSSDARSFVRPELTSSATSRGRSVLGSSSSPEATASRRWETAARCLPLALGQSLEDWDVRPDGDRDRRACQSGGVRFELQPLSLRARARWSRPG